MFPPRSMQNLPLAPSPTRSGRAAGVCKYLTFQIGSEEFAVPVSKVKEIIGWQPVTPVPQTAALVAGVINLRGKVVPVVDLRVKMGMAQAAPSARTCIVVMQPEGAEGVSAVGVIADGVSEVIPIDAAEMEDTAAFSHGLIRSTYIQGAAKIRGQVKILLDIDCVLAEAGGARLQTPGG